MERHEENKKLNIQSNKKEEALFEGIVLPLCKECFMINRTLKQVEQMTNGTGLAEQYEELLYKECLLIREKSKRKLICSDSR